MQTIEEIKARAEEAKIEVETHTAEDMTVHYYRDVTDLIAEIERLQSELSAVKAEMDAAIEDIYFLVLCNSRHCDVCKKQLQNGKRTDDCAMMQQPHAIPCRPGKEHGFEWRGKDRKDG